MSCRNLLLLGILLIGIASASFSLTITTVTINGTSKDLWQINWTNKPVIYRIYAEADYSANWTVKVKNATWEYIVCDWHTDPQYNNTQTITCDIDLNAFWSDIVEGKYNVTIEAVNKSDATKTDVVTFELFGKDITAPTVSADPTSQTWTNQDISVELTASDSLSGVQTLYYAIVSYDLSCPAQGDASYTSIAGLSTTVTISNEGEWKICVYAVDVAGNPSSTREFGPYQIDKTAPTTTVTATKSDDTPYTNNTWVNTDYVKVTLSASDNYDSSPIIVYCKDSTNSCTPNTETTGPITITVYDDGTTYIRFYSKDDAGNAESLRIFVVRIDRSAPEFSVTLSAEGEPYSNDTWTNKSITMNVNITDIVGELDRAEIYINGSLNKTETLSGTSGTITLTFENEGIYDVTVRIYDKAGNINETNLYRVKIDKTAPNIVISATDEEGNTYTNDTWINKNVTVNVAFSDNLAGIETKTVIVNGTEESPTENSWSKTFSEDGIYMISARACDPAGNCNETGIFIVKIDKVKPNVTFDILPVEGEGARYEDWVAGEINITGAAADDRSGLYNVTIFVNDTALTVNGLESFWTTYNTSSISLGAITIRVVVRDNAGNIEEVVKSFNIDNIPPEISIEGIDHTNDTWTKENVTVKINASDEGVGLEKIVYIINGTESSINESEKKLTFTEQGIYEIKAYAVDYLGHKSVEKVFIVKIDRTKPEIISVKVIYPETPVPEEERAAKDGDKITFIIHAKDEFGEIETVRANLSLINSALTNLVTCVKVNGTTSDAYYNCTATIDVEDNFDGVKSVVFYVTDKATWETNKTADVKIDNVEPSIVYAKVIDPWTIEIKVPEKVYDNDSNWLNNIEIAGVEVENVTYNPEEHKFIVRVNMTPGRLNVGGNVIASLTAWDKAWNKIPEGKVVENVADRTIVLKKGAWYFVAVDWRVNTTWSIYRTVLEELAKRGVLKICTYSGGWNCDIKDIGTEPLRGYVIYTNVSNAFIPVKHIEAVPSERSITLKAGWNLISVVDSINMNYRTFSTVDDVKESSLYSLKAKDGSPAFSWIVDPVTRTVYSGYWSALTGIGEGIAYWIYIPTVFDGITYAAPWAPVAP